MKYKKLVHLERRKMWNIRDFWKVPGVNGKKDIEDSLIINNCLGRIFFLCDTIELMLADVSSLINAKTANVFIILQPFNETITSTLRDRVEP